MPQRHTRRFAKERHDIPLVEYTSIQREMEALLLGAERIHPDS
jgi:hypothetical protein